MVTIDSTYPLEQWGADVFAGHDVFLRLDPGIGWRLPAGDDVVEKAALRPVGTLPTQRNPPGKLEIDLRWTVSDVVDVDWCRSFL